MNKFDNDNNRWYILDTMMTKNNYSYRYNLSNLKNFISPLKYIRTEWSEETWIFFMLLVSGMLFRPGHKVHLVSLQFEKCLHIRV